MFVRLEGGGTHGGTHSSSAGSGWNVDARAARAGGRGRADGSISAGAGGHVGRGGASRRRVGSGRRCRLAGECNDEATTSARGESGVGSLHRSRESPVPECSSWRGSGTRASVAGF